MAETSMTSGTDHQLVPVRSLFSVAETVTRRQYIATGLTLAVVKYVIEAAAAYAISGQGFSPVDFVNPWLNSKAPFLESESWLGASWLLFTVPFVWISLAMSIRRANDIGMSPWWAMLMLIPLLNLMAIAVLCVLPSGAFRESTEELATQREQDRFLGEVFAAPQHAFEPVRPSNEDPRFSQRLPAAILTGMAAQLLTGGSSVWLFSSYGFVLFFASPVVAGAAAGFVYSGGLRRGTYSQLGMILLMNVVSFVVMLMVGLDGAICLIMAFPLLFPLSIVGGLIGASLAANSLRGYRRDQRGMFGMILFLPCCLVLEQFDDVKTVYSVTSSVTVNAPPEDVWQQVIAFPEITDELPWLFRLGIAAPMRARIDGHGPGATRYCEFTTGSFVEPIRVWDPPHRLAFDVTEQPIPMAEWTPIPGLHPPHLDDGMKSERGEFLLRELPNGQTELTGTTWYTLNVRPRSYWKCWADPILQAIHRRVLNHIARSATAERPAVEMSPQGH